MFSTAMAQKNKKAIKKYAPREQLEKQRLNILEEIKKTQEELTVLQKDKSATVNELLTLQNKLNARKSLINNINHEINIIEDHIQLANRDVTVLKTSLDTLKKQYAEMVRYTYKNRTSSDLVVFLFSASSFNDALRRLQYVKQYRGYRADQAVKITSASQQLSNKIAILNSAKLKKDVVLMAQQNQSKILETETAQKDRIVNELKGKEKTLLAGLAKNKKAAEDLNRAIGSAIKREIEIAQKRAMEERMKQEKAKKMQADLDRRNALAKKQQEINAAEKLKREQEAQKLALVKKQQEEKQKQALLEKQQREEKERKLAQDRKEREERERKLVQEQKEMAEKERQLSQLAENKRKEREKQLALERQKQDERERQLNAEKQKQEERQRQLLAEKQKQEEYQRRLTEEKKKRELQEQRNNNQSVVRNPRYIPSLASKESNSKTEEADVVSKVEPVAKSSNVKVMKSDDYLYGLTPSERQISSSMEASKGNLPWPVEKGYIVEHFGKNRHPVFNIVTENYGIDIKTSRGAIARAIFPGEVSAVLSIPGTGQTVIVNHGTYFTVYAKLSNTSVTKGSHVGLKQKVGTAMLDDEGNSLVHFEIWKVGANGTSSKLNPELWIAK